MKQDIEQLLHTTKPTLLPKEVGALWNHIQTDITRTPARSPYMVWLRTHTQLAVALVVMVVVITSGATSALAEQARPGDRLFPLDRALERIKFSFARSEEKRTALGIADAEERITELRELIHDSKYMKGNVIATSSTHARVGNAVDALVRVLEESEMSETARERVYENLFNEIDPLRVEVRVDQRKGEGNGNGRVTVDQDDDGETKIEITEPEKRTRIEKKDGHIRVEYEHEGEVRGASEDRDTKGKNKNDTR
jgi:hypothetical protein